MIDQYEVVNPTSLFLGKVGCKEATKIANEITLSFDGPRGKVFASFRPNELVKVGRIMTNIGSNKQTLFNSWIAELGYNKAVLLACNYPVVKVVEMSDEDAESEVEALSN